MIAILTADSLLRRMLELEVTRSGNALTEPDKALLLLMDIDRPVKCPETKNRIVIGLCRTPETPSHKHRVDVMLPLPYPTRALQEILCRYGRSPAVGTKIEHLPGCALLNGKRIPLSPLEEQLFLLLLKRRGTVVPEKELTAVLGNCSRENESNTLQVLLYRLRKKLGFDGISRIRAMRGVGYMMIDEERLYE